MKATRFRNEGTESEQWFCPKCNRWFTPYYYSCSGGRTEASCNNCGQMLETKTVEEIKEEQYQYEKSKREDEETRRARKAYDNYVSGGWY